MLKQHETGFIVCGGNEQLSNFWTFLKSPAVYIINKQLPDNILHCTSCRHPVHRIILQSATQATEILWYFPLEVTVANIIPREAGFPSQEHNIPGLRWNGWSALGWLGSRVWVWRVSRPETELTPQMQIDLPRPCSGYCTNSTPSRASKKICGQSFLLLSELAYSHEQSR